MTDLLPNFNVCLWTFFIRYNFLYVLSNTSNSHQIFTTVTFADYTQISMFLRVINRCLFSCHQNLTDRPPHQPNICCDNRSVAFPQYKSQHGCVVSQHCERGTFESYFRVVFFQHVFWPTRTSEGSEGQSGSCSTNRGSNRGLCLSSGKAWNTAASSSPVFDCVPLQPMTNCTDICWVKINHWTNTVWPSKATLDLWYKRSAVTFRCSEEQRQKKKTQNKWEKISSQHSGVWIPPMTNGWFSVWIVTTIWMWSYPLSQTKIYDSPPTKSHHYYLLSLNQSPDVQNQKSRGLLCETPRFLVSAFWLRCYIFHS